MISVILSVIGWILLGLLCLILIILVLPVTVWLNYDKEGFTAKAGVAFLKITIFPMKQGKAAKPKKQKKPKIEQEQAKTEKKKKKEKKPVDIVLLVKKILSASNKGSKFMIKHIRIRKVKLYIPVYSEDPYETAMSYWKIQGAVGSTRAVMENALNIKFKQLEVFPDFGRQSTKGTCFSCKITTAAVIMVVAGVLAFVKYLRYKPVAYTHKEYLEANPQHLPKLRRQMKRQRQKEQQQNKAANGE